MTVRTKIGTGSLQRPANKPKKTRQGNGAHSKASHGRKKLRGQGK